MDNHMFKQAAALTADDLREGAILLNEMHGVIVVERVSGTSVSYYVPAMNAPNAGSGTIEWALSDCRKAFASSRLP